MSDNTANRTTKPAKPLGRKAYGSIGHLPNSRIGPGDHHVHEGQGRICMEKARDTHDRIIVTEKLDGSNVAVAKIAGEIIALGRAGYPAATSPFEQHHYFTDWVNGRIPLFQAMLEDGEVLHGEWLAQAHGTLYDLHHSPLVAFDLTRAGKRVTWDEHYGRCRQFDIVTPRVVHDGGPIHSDAVLPSLSWSGHGVRRGDQVEGAVWRVERRGAYDFMAKWVRSDKVDGTYLPELSGAEPVWQWRPQDGTVDART